MQTGFSLSNNANNFSLNPSQTINTKPSPPNQGLISFGVPALNQKVDQSADPAI
jgi:hypothetical protein